MRLTDKRMIRQRFDNNPIITDEKVNQGPASIAGVMSFVVYFALNLTLLLFLCGESAWPQAAIESRSAKTWELLAQTSEIGEIAISPDGNRVAWVQKSESEHDGLYVQEWRKGRGAVQLRPTGEGLHGESSPAFSADSDRMAFLSDAGGNGQSQVWVARADGSDPLELTKANGFVARPRWSPDGRRIAFLHVEGGSGGGPLAAQESRIGAIEEAIRNQRVAIVDVGTGNVRLVTPPDLHVYDYDWSPESQRLAVTAAPGPGDDNWWVAQLYVVDCQTGKTSVVYHPRRQIAIPRWSPDGRTIAFIEGLMSDEGFHGGDIQTVSAEGGTARNCTSGRKSSPTWLRWISPSKLFFTEYEGGGSGISILNMSNETIEPLWHGEENLTSGGYYSNFAVADDGSTCASVRQSFQLPPEVWAGAIGSWKQLTHVNNKQKVTWGLAESLEWKSDGLEVQGWLVHPKQEQPGVLYPLVVFVHGGPASVVTAYWPGDIEGPLMSEGYFVLFPNPRGSYGRGEAFTAANIRDFGGGDLRDILTGVDTVLARCPVDPKRVGISGWSYGGYMTMWAVTQTDRFAAAVAGAGIANWQSYYGENLIDQWMIPFFGASVYDDPVVYENSSPISFIKRVKAPTLVVVGERDAECPAPQSFEFWHALKALGVPTQLVVYAGEGHSFADRAHLKDVSERTFEWFEKYMHK